MILCVGTTPVMQRTLVFPRVQIDVVNRATEVHETASGKSVNVARVLHTLGEEAIATGFLGGDSGKFIRDDLAASGLAHDFINVIPKTRTCITLIDQSTGETTELVEEATQVEPPAWDLLRDKIEQLIARATLMVLSGSLPPGAPQDFHHWCITRAGANVRTILDAAGEPLRQALPARPFLIKPNRSELAKTLGTPIETDNELRDAIKQLNADWTVITEGKSGAMVSNGKQFWRFRPPAVQAINPIGSGDSLAAGIACGLSRGQPMPDAARLGIACGAANAMTKTAGVVDKNIVAELLQSIATSRPFSADA